TGWTPGFRLQSYLRPRFRGALGLRAMMESRARGASRGVSSCGAASLVTTLRAAGGIRTPKDAGRQITIGDAEADPCGPARSARADVSSFARAPTRAALGSRPRGRDRLWESLWESGRDGT